MDTSTTVQPSQFKPKHHDLEWGVQNYSVTRAQKNVLDNLAYLVFGLSEEQVGTEAPEDGLYRQDPFSGTVTLMYKYRMIKVKRDGRITRDKGTVGWSE